MEPVEDAELPRVLSVQSHVVSGYVGNRAAVFPLQLLGFDVDFVNSGVFGASVGLRCTVIVYSFCRCSSIFQPHKVQGHEGTSHECTVKQSCPLTPAVSDQGSVLSGDDLRELSVGLESNALLQYDYLLTGYIGSESFLRSMLDLLADIQKARPTVRYVPNAYPLP